MREKAVIESSTRTLFIVSKSIMHMNRTNAWNTNTH